MNLAYIIKRPIVTEKSLQLAAGHKYTFEVDPRATKSQIKVAVAKFFKVKVLSVRTMNMFGVRRRRPGKKSYFHTPNWKKAIVQLSKDQMIDLFEVEKDKSGKSKDKKGDKLKKVKKKEKVKE